MTHPPYYANIIPPLSIAYKLIHVKETCILAEQIV